MSTSQSPRQVILKTQAEIEQMRPSGRMVGETLAELSEMVKPGRKLSELDQYVLDKFERLDVIPTFLGYQGFPHTICASINEQIVHGFATERRLEEGDILSIDLGATINGWVGDSAITIGVGSISPEAQRLLQVTSESLHAGIAVASIGVRKGDIGAAIQEVIESAGYGVVRGYVGHGVGRDMHEPPNMPNYGRPGSGMTMRRGMVVALEPMATVGDPATAVLDDGWTVVTADGSLSAHFEHTVALRESGPAEILTQA
ncbi:MAG: type I methionyl aminopeptidase [Chloroflexota bacterium]|nr:type I methionyl aminopeptidase [Chloroflexota bacterium]